MIKRIFLCLLLATLLYSLAVIVSAETLPDEEAPDFDTSAIPPSEESDTSTPGWIVPSESDLPEGYVVDEDFFIRLTLNAENAWSYNLEDLMEGWSDEYIYFVEETHIPQDYNAIYTIEGVILASGVNIGDVYTLEEDLPLTDGNIIVITNVKEGEPPIYELPETGGTGRTPYTIAGVAVLLTAAVYLVILRRKQKSRAA